MKSEENRKGQRKRRCTIFIVLLTFFAINTSPLLAQGTRTIGGIVKDETGEPLPGATVAQRREAKDESQHVVICDVNGHFSLSLPNNTVAIEVSYLGFETLTVNLTESNSYEIVLLTDDKMLGEVVVTGMFERNQNTFTGAVSTVGKEELMRAGNQNVIQSLKNIDPSFVQLDNLLAGSNPNAMPDLQMRGQSSFPDLKGEYQTNPNQPLFILDGFETELSKIIDLDMNIVESITLLKDATAKAIYGAKAANGVVVVETKRPSAGSIRFT